jgi:hypothetical protein
MVTVFPPAPPPATTAIFPSVKPLLLGAPKTALLPGVNVSAIEVNDPLPVGVVLPWATVAFEGAGIER